MESRLLDNEKPPADLHSLQMANPNAYTGHVSTEIYVRFFIF